MQDINAAYQSALKACNGQVSHDSENRAHEYRYNEEAERAAMEKVLELLQIIPAGVEVWLIGLWIWIQGTKRDDRATQTALKAAGCVWHSKRACWYWRAPELRHRGRGSRHSLSGLAIQYGCRAFGADETRQTAVAMA
jgi:hypothetical protein